MGELLGVLSLFLLVVEGSIHVSLSHSISLGITRRILSLAIFLLLLLGLHPLLLLELLLLLEHHSSLILLLLLLESNHLSLHDLLLLRRHLGHHRLVLDELLLLLLFELHLLGRQVLVLLLGQP